MADRSLEDYRRRRDRRKTPEPAGRRGSAGKRPRFLGLRRDKQPEDVSRERTEP